MATKTFVCSRGTHPCDTRRVCDTFCDHTLVLSWMARVAMMTQRFFLGLIAVAQILLSRLEFTEFSKMPGAGGHE